MTRKPLPIFLAIAMIVLLSATAFAQSIPAGTRVAIRMGSTLNSGKANSGDNFDGSLANDLVVNGQTVAHRGDPVRGRVTHVVNSGRLKKPGELGIRLTSINGQAVTTNTAYFKGKSHTKSNVTKIGGGAAAGALLGGLMGGGKGAAIGAGVGAGAGTGVAMATGKQEVEVKAEQTVSFTTTGGSASPNVRRR